MELAEHRILVLTVLKLRAVIRGHFVDELHGSILRQSNGKWRALQIICRII